VSIAKAKVTTRKPYGFRTYRVLETGPNPPKGAQDKPMEGRRTVHRTNETDNDSRLPDDRVECLLEPKQISKAPSSKNEI